MLSRVFNIRMSCYRSKFFYIPENDSRKQQKQNPPICFSKINISTSTMEQVSIETEALKQLFDPNAAFEPRINLGLSDVVYESYESTKIRVYEFKSSKNTWLKTLWVSDDRIMMEVGEEYTTALKGLMSARGIDVNEIYGQFYVYDPLQMKKLAQFLLRAVYFDGEINRQYTKLLESF